MADCLIGLGSNLGDRGAQLDQACRLLCGHPQIQLRACSTFRATRPIGGPGGQEAFLNAALRITTSLPPEQLLLVVRDVEQQLGRERHERWGPRVIDVDVLLYDQQVVDTDELTLPHPRMAVRRFVLGPACEVAAEMIHPTTGWSIARLLQRLDELPRYVAIAGTDPAQTAHLAVTVAQRAGAHVLLDPLAPAGAGAQNDARVISVDFQLEMIDARLGQLLSLSAARGTPSTDWHVCSYWLPQSLAVARTWPAGPACRQVEQACALAIGQMSLPQCIVFLDSRPHAADAASGADGPVATQTGRSDGAAVLAQELARQLVQPGQGPVLWIRGGDLPLAVTETIAAIDAMR
jgi:2-amino-4-hydroxy-6-hydroxymethyldihydropteridine diphosphokinase